MLVPTEIQERFATRLGPHSIGGIMLCGINWGDGGDAKNHTTEINEKSNWTTYFSESGNQYPYQRRIITWLNFWGFKLSSDNPTDLDKAISQTNLFPDQSKHDYNREREDWEMAIQNLIESINFLMPSGIIFFSIPIFREVMRKAKKITPQKWIDVMGDPAFGRPAMRFNDPVQSKKYFEILFPSDGNKIPIAAMPHPTAPFFNRYKSDAAAAEAKPVMRPWLEEALNKYKEIQTKVRT